MDFKRARNGEWRENEIRFGAEYWEIWRQIDDEARVETKGKIPFDFQRGERGALDRQNKPWLCFYRDRETSFSVCFHESRGGTGKAGKNWRPGETEPRVRIGTRIENSFDPTLFTLFFNRGIQAARSHLAATNTRFRPLRIYLLVVTERTLLSHCSRLVLSLLLFSPSPPLPFPSPFISFFHPFFPLFLFSTVGRGTACVWRVIDSTSNSIKRENALSAQRRHRFHDWSSPIGPTNGRPWFFLLFPFFGKITATDGKRKKEYLDLRVIFSPFFLFFLSFFLSFHKSKRNSFYLEKKKTRNHSSKEQVNV